MQAKYAIGDGLAGYLASVNFAGYLIGALTIVFFPKKRRFILFRVFLIVLISVTALMGTDPAYWSVLRFLAGVSSSVLFIVGSEMIMALLLQEKQMHKFGIVLSGVEVGIVLTGSTVPLLAHFIGVDNTWIALGLISLLPAIWVLRHIHPLAGELPGINKKAVQSKSNET